MDNILLISASPWRNGNCDDFPVNQWMRWLGGSSLKTRLRLVAFQAGELAANTGAVNKLKKLAKRIL